MKFVYFVLCTFYLFCTDNVVMSLWDFAITTRSKIIFFDNDWSQISTAAHQFDDLSALAFDETEEKMYFSDKGHINGSIFSLKLPLDSIDYNGMSAGVKANGGRTHEIIEKVVTRVTNETIGGIAFDPLDRVLYWSDAKLRKIYRLRVSESNQTNEPETFIDFSNDESIPNGIALDICDRKIYWTNSNHKNPSIQRTTLKGMGIGVGKIETLIDTELFLPQGIVVDQFSRRIYWVVDLQGVHYSVESSNLDGSDRQTIVKGLNSVPYDLAVTKKSIYWTDLTHNAIWNTSKEAIVMDEQPSKVYNFSIANQPRGIIARFGILSKLTNIPRCKAVISTIKSRLIQKSSMTSISTQTESMEIVKTKAKPDLFCLNNGEYNSLSEICICKIGFKGIRCETSECHNFCVHGTCSVSSMGFPECTCQEGFYGERCETYKCSEFCLNGGHCEIIETIPTCHCPDRYTGHRCETNSTEICSLFCHMRKYDDELDIPFGCLDICDELAELNSNEGDLANLFNNLRHQHRDTSNCNSTYTIVIIGLSVLLALCLVLLIIYTIRKTYKPARPRIRKTFVVQKKLNGHYNGNQTPLTSRPMSAVEKCEITIEDCCNMNICDTPCFDPKTLQQSFDNCSKNDDKKFLVDSMEEDLY